MSKVYTASEVEKHNTPKKLWIVIRKNVYDVTAYLKEHPGGMDPLLEAGGMDATNAFEEVGHSSDAKKILKKYKIGTLAPGDKCVPGTNVCVYRCEDDANPWRKRKLPCSDRRGGICRPIPRPRGGKLKWALLALAVAIVAGVAYKKYAS